MTSSKLPPPHVRAWYFYSFAAEVFSACALAIFLPITLEQLAKEIGYYAPDYTEPCKIASEADNGDERICKAHILGVWVDPASFSMYVKSVAVAVQAVCIISIGPLADSPYWRKRLLFILTYTGSFSAILFILFPSTSSATLVLLAGLLFIVGNTTYSIGTVCSNAFLPVLARENDDVQNALQEANVVRSEDEDLDDLAGYRRASLDVEGNHVIRSGLGPAVRAISAEDLAESDPVDTTSSPKSMGRKTHYETLLSLTISRLSSVGTALGFLSGVSALALLLIPVILLKESTFSLRLAIALSGIWWAVFTIPSWLGLPSGTKEDANRTEKKSFKDAWKRIGNLIRPKEIRSLPNLYLFLFAWIFLSDGFHTITYTSILFCKSVLSFSPSEIIFIGILVQFSAITSSITVPKLQHRLTKTNFNILFMAVLAGGLIPIYACVGLMLGLRVLSTKGEMYVLATWFGLVFGLFLSYSRAVYTELIPPGHESTFFSLFAFTDKSASFVGPAVVGLIADLTGNLRYGFIFLLIMLTVPIPVLLRVSVRRGKEDAHKWSESKLAVREGDEEITGLLGSS
ncbi:hypothetical protein I203_100111 [Kwoniella mangroviensis CBS 8507]|uniref:uncharacterized protein n=1 Tax=Kwoniella mangroviensis CBS 8507 TaxID=1296122 RepID=UPI00080D13B2|nr:UMF1 family MFS transporter [Kwoniella mangroviensis CBS 8507]OCF62948.1 UMF1 family MFS transporter [Kwoniella mangroviensis CBS 8507]